MIESIFHLFKIHGKMILGNSSIIIQDMLGIAPKPLNAVDVILGAFVHQCPAVVQSVMLTQPFQGIVAPECVGVIYCALPRLLSNNRHQLFLRHMLHYARIHLAVALQKAKCNAFACRAPSALALAPTTEVRFVHLNLAMQFTTFQLRHMIDGFTQVLIDARDGLIIKAEIMRETISRLLLIKPPHNGNLGSCPLQRLLFSAGLVSAPHISPRGLAYFERTTEYTLFTPQKVGRAPKNILFPCNHKDMLTPHGYETH